MVEARLEEAERESASKGLDWGRAHQLTRRWLTGSVVSMWLVVVNTRACRMLR